MNKNRMVFYFNTNALGTVAEHYPLALQMLLACQCFVWLTLLKQNHKKVFRKLLFGPDPELQVDQRGEVVGL